MLCVEFKITTVFMISNKIHLYGVTSNISSFIQLKLGIGQVLNFKISNKHTISMYVVVTFCPKLLQQ